MGQEMSLSEWEKQSVDELEADYNRLSDNAKAAFHDVILEWQIHPGWVIACVAALFTLVGKYVL